MKRLSNLAAALTLLVASLASLAVHASEPACVEGADAKAEIRQALSAAGAAPLMAREFKVTKAGELADARNLGEAGIHDFFKGVSAGAAAK